MDPFAMGLLALTGANNPEAFSTAMSQLGMSPSGSNEMLTYGGLGQGLGAFLNPSGGAASVGGMPGGMDIAGLLKGLGGFKGPEAVKPIMSGGVTGGVSAPQQNIQGLAQSPVMAALMQLIQSGGAKNPLRVPQLGAILRGGGYNG